MSRDEIASVLTAITDSGRVEKDFAAGGYVLFYYPWGEQHGLEWVPLGHGRIVAVRGGVRIREKGIRYKRGLHGSIKDFLDQLATLNGWVAEGAAEKEWTDEELEAAEWEFRGVDDE